MGFGGRAMTTSLVLYGTLGVLSTALAFFANRRLFVTGGAGRVSEAVAEIRAAGGAQGPAANRQSMTRTSWSPQVLSTDSQWSGPRRTAGRAGKTNATASHCSSVSTTSSVSYRWASVGTSMSATSISTVTRRPTSATPRRSSRTGRRIRRHRTTSWSTSSSSLCGRSPTAEGGECGSHGSSS
jgi:hypothetical protein